jgi:hypothetical protein
VYVVRKEDFMSKHQDHKQKKKLTKKELKALNHAKLMASKGQNNVIQVQFHQQNTDQQKKAA